MRRSAGIVAAGVGVVLAGCGGSVPGLSALDGAWTQGGVYGSARTQSTRAQRTAQRSPWDINALRKAATNPVFSSGRMETVGDKNIVVREVSFAAEPLPGTTLPLSGSLATPAQPPGDRPRLPALVLVGDREDLPSGEQAPGTRAAGGWAARGYAALALDLPGRATGGEKGRSSGPEWTDAALANPSPAANPLHVSVAAIIAAVNLLSAQPEVDAHRLGLVGEGWGGVVAALASAVDHRPRALVVARAAGGLNRGPLAAALQNLPAKDRDAWVKAYDPDSYAAAEHPATLFLRPLSVVEPPLPTLVATFHGWSGVKALALIPPDARDSETVTETAWLASRLSVGTSLPEIRSVRAEGDGAVVTVGEKLLPQSVAIFYTSSEVSEAEWKSVAGEKVGEHDWRCVLPKPAQGQSLTVFAALTGAGGAIICSEPDSLTSSSPAVRGGSITARQHPPEKKVSRPDQRD